MPLIEKILSSKLGKKVRTNEFIFFAPDKTLLCDALGAHVLSQLSKLEQEPVFDFGRVYATCGRNFPPRDIATSNFFSKYKKLINKFNPVFLGPESAGVLHNVLADHTELKSGEILVGTDSHTLTAGAFGLLSFGIGVEEMVAILRFGKTWLKVPPTVKINLHGKLHSFITARDAMFHIMKLFGREGLIGKAIEFWDFTNEGLNRDERMVMCSLGAECGVVTALFVLNIQNSKDAYLAEKDYHEVVNINLAQIEQPLVSHPDDPFNIYSLAGSKDIPINYCFIGTCSGGGISGLREAATALAGKKKSSNVTLVVSPQSQKIYFDAVTEGIIETLVKAGAVVTTPTCGACLSSHSGVLSSDDVCISTGNRNYKGRMGDPNAKIFLASPRVVALASVFGKVPSFNQFIQ